MADLPSNYEIISPDDSDGTTALDVLQSIFPYFPDDTRMANYLCYISSGWSRTEALSRCKATKADRDIWRKDPSFKEIDDTGYGELRKSVADAYAERIVRRNTIEWMEFDHALLETARAKWEEGISLTRDETNILLKRAGTYSPEALQVVNKLMTPKSEQLDSGGGLGEALDIVALVMARQRRQ